MTRFQALLTKWTDKISGNNNNSGGNTSTTSVPEPSSLLGMFGVASLAMFFRKRL